MSMDELNLPNDVEQLKAIIAERESVYITTIAEHEQIITQYTEKMTQHETVIASQHDTIEKQRKKLAGLQQQVARLLRRQYGPQKERKGRVPLTRFELPLD